MIDMEKEPLITLAQATTYVPQRRGKKVHVTTLWRWVTLGHHGIHLDALKSPGGWFTSVAAVQRFLAAVARRELPNQEQAKRREREIAVSRSHEESMRRHRQRGLVE